jgi:hypothetical protein
LDDVSPQDWLKQIVADKASQCDAAASQDDKPTPVFEDAADVVGFVMNHARHRNTLRSLVDRNSAKDIQVLLKIWSQYYVFLKVYSHNSTDCVV